MSKANRKNFQNLLTTIIRREAASITRSLLIDHNKGKNVAGITKLNRDPHYNEYQHILGDTFHALDPYVVLNRSHIMREVADNFGLSCVIPLQNVKAFAQSYFRYTNSIILKARTDEKPDCIYVSQGGSYYTYYIDANNGKLVVTESDEVPDIYSEYGVHVAYTFDVGHIKQAGGDVRGLLYNVQRMKEQSGKCGWEAINLVLDVLDRGDAMSPSILVIGNNPRIIPKSINNNT